MKRGGDHERGTGGRGSPVDRRAPVPDRLKQAEKVDLGEHSPGTLARLNGAGELGPGV